MSERLVISIVHDARAITEREVDDIAEAVLALVPDPRRSYVEECYTEDAEQ